MHLSIRAHNGDFLFRPEVVKSFIYALLLSLKSIFGILVFDYVLMDNHIHLILWVPSTEALSRFMQRTFSALACFVNKLHGRSGRVFGERARTPVLQDGRRLLVTMRYLSLNPVRAGMTASAHEYRWSGYRHYAFGEPDPLIDDAQEYLGLSGVAATRRKMYQELVAEIPGRGARKLPEMTSRYFVGEIGWVRDMLRRRGFLSKRHPP
ncbi:MAG TPA: transposase [Myxococcota bacterium]|nr:transposase [Myxococcota bacterium]HRY97316.1 transposase [Myxococcota bacterium]HSA23178.1 transposase [Myxococcota bacterium]